MRSNLVDRKKGVFKSNASIRLGALEYRVLAFIAESGENSFTPYRIVKGLDVDKRRVNDCLKRLIARGFIARTARGFYKLLVSIESLAELLVKAIPVGPRTKNGSDFNSSNGGVPRRIKDSHGTSPQLRLRVPIILLDNVRGFNGGGYVPGDRGRVLGFEDLVFFRGVSYAEFTTPTFTNAFRGLGCVVVYYSDKGVPGVGVVPGDWVEWRPPRGFVKRRGVVAGRRFYRFRVLPFAFGVLARACVLAGVPFDLLARVLYSFARELYLYLRRSGVASPIAVFDGFDGGVLFNAT